MKRLDRESVRRGGPVVRSRRTRSTTGLRVRRSPHLAAFWKSGTIIACNYATGVSAKVPPNACELLTVCDDWTSVETLASAGLVAPSELAAVIERMVALTLLERSDRPRDPRAVAMDAMQSWNPQAGFFHATTRDVPFTPSRLAQRMMREKAARHPPPPQVKHYPHQDRIDLAPPALDDGFATVLRARRTWRRYSSLPVTRDEIGTLLGLAAGVQKWITADGLELPLKTSPSGGARHSIECYLVARDVKGLKRGVYHYAPDRHALTKIGPRVPKDRLRAYVPGSEYFADASAFVFFTSMFERLLWRYPYARAYRAAFIEAGHVCQTFCLTATRLGLAPFCVMALADSVIEQDLGIDGVNESVLYAAGVGRPPRGSTWAARPKGPNPKVRLNPRLQG